MIKKKNLLPKIIFIVVFLVVWEIIAKMRVFPELLFPPIEKILKAFIDGFLKDGLLSKTWVSVWLLIRGLFIGAVLAFVLSGLSIVSKSFYSVYNMVVSMFDLIPGVALIPLAILWIGIGDATIIFIVVHSVVWPMSRNILDGFQTIPKIYIEAGRNLGLKNGKLVTDVYIPAAFTSILSGLKVGWARAWRGLISVEMIFGASSSGAGIGWYIYTKRTNIDIAGVFATLIVIVIVGVIVEYGVFRAIENRTVRKWGMIR